MERGKQSLPEGEGGLLLFHGGGEFDGRRRKAIPFRTE